MNQNKDLDRLSVRWLNLKGLERERERERTKNEEGEEIIT
jgi:urease accessory protein UreE